MTHSWQYFDEPNAIPVVVRNLAGDVVFSHPGLPITSTVGDARKYVPPAKDAPRDSSVKQVQRNVLMIGERRLQDDELLRDFFSEDANATMELSLARECIAARVQFPDWIPDESLDGNEIGAIATKASLTEVFPCDDIDRKLRSGEYFYAPSKKKLKCRPACCALQ